MKAAKNSVKVTKAEMTVGSPATTINLVAHKGGSLTLSITEWHSSASIELDRMEIAALVNSLVSAVYEQEDRTVTDSDSGFLSVSNVDWKVKLDMFSAGHDASATLTRDEALTLVDHIHSF